jgi:hypothetical protein
MSTAHSFGSALASAFTSYLALKKALGRRFATETAILVHLDRFLVEQGPGWLALTPGTFAAWSITLAHLTPTVRRNRMRIVRNLCSTCAAPICATPMPYTRCFAGTAPESSLGARYIRRPRCTLD